MCHCSSDSVHYYGDGDDRDLQRVDRRQRQMGIRDRYVMVEGSVTLAPNGTDIKELATRYLGAETGVW